ncbi:MAG: energy transducer TonB [Flammeovirgaceae bacterium]
MMKVVFFALLVINSTYCFGQYDTLEFIDGTYCILKGDTLLNYTKSQRHKNGESPFMIVEQGASFPGGTTELTNYLAMNLTIPKEAIAKNTDGIVNVIFTIDKKGMSKNIEAVGDTTLGRGKEAIRLIKSMPRWKPAFQHGIARSMRLTFPINFSLNAGIRK